MKKIILTLIAIATLSLSSCTKWLDINYSPNNPSAEQVNNDMIFPAAEMALSARYGDQLRIVGGYLSEHFAHFFGTSNYVAYSQFLVTPNQLDATYILLNAAAIANATTVRDNAEAEEDWGSYLAATCIRVFTYQVLVDALGEIPYSEAQKSDNLNPKYDEGKDIYAGLVEELNNALAKAKDGDAVVTNFLYPNEPAANWIKFANALKLKLLMRERAKVSVDDQLTALVNENNFPGSDVAWKGIWADEGGKGNPFYQEEFATYFGATQINVALNVALLNTMSAYDDGRLAAFFSRNNDGEFWGSISGDNLSTSKNFTSGKFCRPNMKYDSPVYLISLAEVNFFLSEYYHKVAKNEAKAKEYYEAAIQASFASASANGSGAAIAAWPYDGSDKNLGVQKWIALSGTNNFEAWCELRRLGYPAFGGKKAEDIYDFTNDVMSSVALTPGELYTPYKVDPVIGANALTQRLPYPTASTDYNSNHPELKPNSTPVFWAE